jgi:Ca2+-binding EF-hand superfamily protein
LVQQFALYNSSGAAASSSTGSNARGGPASSSGSGAQRSSAGAAGSGVVEQQASSGLVLNAQQQHTMGATSARALAPARQKLDELLQHWSQLPETAILVDRLVSDALAQIGEGSRHGPATKEPAEPAARMLSNSSNNNSSASTAAVASPATPGASTSSKARGGDTAEALVITDDDSSDGDFELPEEQGAAARPMTDAPVVASPPAGNSTNNPRSSAGSNSGAAAAGGASSGGIKKDKPSSSVPGVAVSMDDLPGDLGGFALGSGSDVTASPSKNSPSAAARKSANNEAMPSPRTNAALHTPPTRTPREGGTSARHLGPQGMLADEMDVAHRYGALSPRAISPGAQDGSTPVKSPFDTLLRSPRAGHHPAFGALDAPPKSRSPSPQPLQRGASPGVGAGGDDSDREMTPRQHTGGRRRSISSLGSSFSELPTPAKAVPVASKDDIPRFYFARGRQLQNADTLSEEVAGRAQAAKEAAARARAADEREVQLMNRFVSQASAAASASAAPTKRPGANGRLASAAKRNSTAATAASQQEAVQNAVRSLTTEAFGLPRVLSTVVASKVVKQPGNSLTLSQTRTFYDTCIAKNSRPRRIFETLLGSSPLAPAIERHSQGQRRNYLVKEDFTLLLTSLVEHHPGLSFLKEAADFQSKYIETVLLRIFFECDPRDTGRITWEAFNNSELPGAVQQLAETDEINHVLAFFSYEHFYVLYCRFWELDSDKDLFINAADFERYFPEQTANDLLVQRVFQGVGRKLQSKQKDRMGYDDFVYFCLCEEDKAHPRALKYWFKLLDIDGDGVLSGYELATFYDITKKRWEQLTGEAIAFPDVMCQVQDMLCGPAHDGTVPADLSGSPAGSPAGSFAPGGSGKAGPLGVGPLLGAPRQPLTGLDLMSRFGSSRPATPSGSGSAPVSPGAPALFVTGTSGGPAKGSKPPQARPVAGAASKAGGPGSGVSSPAGGMSWSATLPPGTDPMTIGFTLADLMRRPLAASVALTMITNVSKFLQYEQRDPFVIAHERAQGGLERNEWDRFCRAEYDRMSLAEEDG